MVQKHFPGDQNSCTSFQAILAFGGAGGDKSIEFEMKNSGGYAIVSFSFFYLDLVPVTELYCLFLRSIMELYCLFLMPVTELYCLVFISIGAWDFHLNQLFSS